MKKVTEKAIGAFNDSVDFKMGNTEVEALPNVTILKLHGNKIAYRYNDPERTLSITTCGWDTATTRERLNGIDGVSVFTRSGKLYLNGKEWDGELIDVK